MADVAGWKAVEKFVSDPLCDGETMERRWRKAKKEAKEEEVTEKGKGEWGGRSTFRGRAGQGVYGSGGAGGSWAGGHGGGGYGGGGYGSSYRPARQGRSYGGAAYGGGSYGGGVPGGYGDGQGGALGARGHGGGGYGGQRGAGALVGAATPRYNEMNVDDDPVVVEDDLDFVVPDSFAAGALSSASSVAGRAIGGRCALVWPGQGAQGARGPGRAMEEPGAAGPREGLRELEFPDVINAAARPDVINAVEFPDVIKAVERPDVINTVESVSGSNKYVKASESFDIFEASAEAKGGLDKAEARLDRLEGVTNLSLS